MKRSIGKPTKKGVQIWAVTTVSGIDYAYGQDASLANGSTSSAYVIDSAEIANIAPSEIPTTDFIGGGGELLARMFTGQVRYEQFDIELADYDDALVAWLGANAVNTTTNTQWRQATMATSAADLFTVGMAITYQLIPDSGTPKYHTVVFPKCNILVLPNPGEKDSRRTKLQVSPRKATYAPSGETLTSMANIADGDHYTMTTVSPIHVLTFKADGSTDTFNTTYQPKSTTITINASTNQLAINGTLTALSSIVVSSGLATLAAAGSAGDTCVLIYEHDNFKAVV